MSVRIGVAVFACACTGQPQLPERSQDDAVPRRNVTARPTVAATGTPTASDDDDAGVVRPVTDAAATRAAAGDDTLAVVVAERPYLPGRRRRADGRVQASTDDEALARWNVGGTGDPRFVSNRAGFHPGPRVVVDTRVVSAPLPQRGRGVLTEAKVRAQTRSRGYWPFRICLEAGLRTNQELKGKTRIRFSIGSRGSVTAARLLETNLDDETVAECLRDEALESLKFKPPPRRRVDVDATIKGWPGDAPVPSWTDPADRPDAGPEPDPSVLAPVAAELLQPARRCYAPALGHDPGLWGRLEIHVELDPDGRVISARESDSRFPDSSVTECILAAVRASVFPRIHDDIAAVVIPIRLGKIPQSGD